VLRDADDSGAHGVETMPRLASAVLELERKLLVRALRSARGARARAAELLGISRRVLARKCDQHGITDLELEAASRAAEAREAEEASGPRPLRAKGGGG
jgi:DNA-binding NtrC family response regulator